MTLQEKIVKMNKNKKNKGKKHTISDKKMQKASNNMI